MTLYCTASLKPDIAVLIGENWVAFHNLLLVASLGPLGFLGLELHEKSPGRAKRRSRWPAKALGGGRPGFQGGEHTPIIIEWILLLILVDI